MIRLALAALWLGAAPVLAQDVITLPDTPQDGQTDTTPPPAAQAPPPSTPAPKTPSAGPSAPGSRPPKQPPPPAPKPTGKE